MTKINEQWTLWQRNVHNKFKSIPTETIREELKKTALPCAVFMSQIQGDFNFSCVIRSSNNFNVSKVFYFGKKHFDIRGSCGSHHYTEVVHLSFIEDVLSLKKDYTFVALENNIDDVVSLPKFKWPTNSLLILGEESTGIPQEILNVVDFKVEIPSLGSVRSINVASAASIALYDYYSKLNLDK